MYYKAVTKTIRILVFLVIVATINLLSDQQVLAQTPTPFLISPYFGEEVITQNYHSGHRAIDFGLSYERILAAESGTVYYVKWYNNNCHQYWNPQEDFLGCGYGLHVRINHPNEYRTYYAHLSATAFNLGTTSSWARQGQIIGTSGHTGYSSGPHLHFVTRHRINGIWNTVNPFSETGVSLWEDGQWANPSRPIPEPLTSGEIIVDDNANNSGGFSKGRNSPFSTTCPSNNCPDWYPAAAGYGNDMYYTYVNGSNPDYWAKWQPSGIPDGGGIYEIYVYVPNVNATSWKAPYTVVHALGNTTARVDQYGLYNQWVSIGTYVMRPWSYVYTTDATGDTEYDHCGSGQYCKLGVDAVKFVRMDVTYLPSYAQGGSWSSDIFVRNNGGPAWEYKVFYDSNGTSDCGTAIEVPANATIHGATCPGAASVVVDATQDMAVVIQQTATGRTIMDNSFITNSMGDPSFERTGNTLYAPAVYNKKWGWNSVVYLVNTGTDTTDVALRFKGRSGGYSNKNRYVYNVPPNGTYILTASSVFLFYCLGRLPGY